MYSDTVTIGNVRGLLIGLARDDETMESFHRPIVFHEGDGEVIEKLRMAGEFALHAKVIQGLDQTDAKEGRPLPVDHDACGQRILCRNEPTGKLEPVRWRCFLLRPNG